MQGRLADRAIPADVARELTELRAENARLRRLLKLTRAEASPPGPAQAGFFDAPPGPVHAGSPPDAKVALFGALFAARTDIYAVRWQNARTGRAGWLPAVRGGGVDGKVRRPGCGPLVQIGSSPPWPGPRFGLGELAVENQGELVDHGVFPMLAVPADKRADELGAELRVPPVE